MQLLTFNEILTSLCDNFDSLISPRSIARTNTNIIYLMFKAIAKGYEVINNVCVTLSNKFNPSSCSDEDLNSVADLVGTQKYTGSASGLNIIATNNGDSAVTLYPGVYTYALDDDTSFSFVIIEAVTIAPGENHNFIAFSNDIGSYPVTAQTSIEVTSDSAISSEIVFSCTDNSALLGIAPETDLEFRKRINTDTTRQDSLVELQTTLKNLPYIFDCCIYFNNTADTVTYDGYEIPSFFMAIFYSGEVRNEIAEIVASKSIFPTLESEASENTEASVAVFYRNDVFVNGMYQVNLIPFKRKKYSVNIYYKINSTYADANVIETAIRTALYTAMNKQIHYDYVKENDIYTVIENLEISGIELLNVDIVSGGSVVSYLEVPSSAIPELENVTFNPA